MRLLTWCLLLWSSQIVSAQWPTFQEVSSSRGINDVAAISYLYGNGAAIADYDKDGDLDFFLCTAGGVADRLYSNNGNGVFTDMAQELGVNSTKLTRLAIWFDFDADSDLDLITLSDCYLEGCSDPITINCYEQRSNGTFGEVSESIGLEFGESYVTNLSIAGGGLSAGDLNNDGYLDLIISVWGGPITYFENDTQGGFINKSELAQIGSDFQYRWQPIIYDFNQDGFQDVYVNVDFDANELWLNNGDATFTDEAANSFSNSAYNEMGIALGDYDNDGDFDIYATNISRIDDGVLRHNILLKNQFSSTGVLVFNEVSNALQVGASGWDWGTTFMDANNDGQQDLVATNGWTPDNWNLDRSRLWLNLGDGLFGDISDSSNFNDVLDATSLMAFDMDRDGDLDLLQTLKENDATNAAVQLYENQLSETAQPGNYIVVKPRADDPNHFGIGAVVKVTANNDTQMKLITAGTSLYAQEPSEAYFGLGDADNISEIKILWPDGEETIFKDIEPNQMLTVSKDGALSTNEFKSTALSSYPNPVDDVWYIQSIEEASTLRVFNLLGQSVLTKKLNLSRESLDLSQLQEGVYQVVISANNSNTVSYMKLMKR